MMPERTIGQGEMIAWGRAAGALLSLRAAGVATPPRLCLGTQRPAYGIPVRMHGSSAPPGACKVRVQGRPLIGHAGGDFCTPARLLVLAGSGRWACSGCLVVAVAAAPLRARRRRERACSSSESPAAVVRRRGDSDARVWLGAWAIAFPSGRCGASCSFFAVSVSLSSCLWVSASRSPPVAAWDAGCWPARRGSP
ncbi:hypothetical protein BKA66DRAFT_553147 [Pyrenochaeta sp. MPI-SDFR-AT-0127]|nr:hypothetical protein BKA66DRAFT_553147 [Pyrenochaeta sp. MPI-SDFR-AT-0127]